MYYVFNRMAIIDKMIMFREHIKQQSTTIKQLLINPNNLKFLITGSNSYHEAKLYPSIIPTLSK